MSAPCPDFGFIVTIRSAASRSPAIVADLLSVLEANDLSADVRGIGTQEVVVRRDGAQATHADREVVRAWADPWIGVATIAIGDIVDLENYR